MKLPLPEDPRQRALVVAIVCSVLFHVLLLGSMIWTNLFGPSLFAKRGETLFVDITPEKSEEKAPLGNPARPAGPPKPEPRAKAPVPPAPRPKVAEAPVPPAPKAAPSRPAPEPPRQVARAAPPAPEPPVNTPPPPAPEPTAAAAPPQQAAPRETAPAPATQPRSEETSKSQDASPGPTPAPSGTHTALAKPPAEPSARIFRQPGGGGGLYGGRGGTAGEPVPLDTDDPNYREYMQRVKQRIYAKWGYPYEAQTRGLQGKLIVEFHIAKDGHLQFIELKHTSGEEILDSFAMTAVKLAQVYDPLPDNMKRDVLPIVAVFVYTLRGPLSVFQSLQ